MNTAGRLKFDEVVTLEGERWRVKAFSAADLNVKLVSVDDDRQVLWMPVMEVARLREHTGPAVDLQLYPDDKSWPEDVLRMVDQIREVRDGTPLPGREPNPDYALDVPIGEKIEAKVTDLNKAGIAITERTLRRRVAEYKKAGSAGVARTMLRRSRKSSGLPNIDERIEAAILDVLADATYDSTRGPEVRALQIKRLLKRRYPDDPELWSYNIRSYQRWLQPYVGRKQTFGNARSREYAAGNTPERMYKRGAVVRPGQRVEVDATQLNVMVRDSEGNVFRPEITMLVDGATRAFLSWGFTRKTSDAFDNALLLARAAVPLPLRPGHEDLVLARSATLPHEMLTELDVRRAGSYAMPFIFPEEITMDGGASFRGTVFESGCMAYGITLNYAAPRTGRHKAKVERHHGTVGTSFARWLAGYTGTYVAHRGKHVEAVWDLAELDVLFNLWYCRVYLNSPHGGLRNPFNPQDAFTPNQMYAATVEVSAAGIPVPFTEADYIGMMPFTDRVIDHDGIRVFNRQYDSPDLDGMRDVPGPRPKGRWRIHYDPYQPETVWVHRPETNEWASATDKTLPYRATSPFILDVETNLASGSAPPTLADKNDLREGFFNLATDRQDELRRAKPKSRVHSDLPKPSPPEPRPHVVPVDESEEVEPEIYGPIDVEEG